MAHSYTPGLRVARLTHIVRERRLPLKGNVMVSKGDTVKAEQVVARTELPGNVHPVNCAGQLGILPADIQEALVIKTGSNIKKDEVIAISKSFFGLFKSTCISPIDGVLENASPITGQLILREPPMPVEVLAYLDGTVSKVFEDEGIEVETSGAIIQGIFGIGGERHGRIKMLVSSPDQTLDEDGITGDLSGCIAVGGGRLTLDGFKKAMAAGAVAVVTGCFKNVHLKGLLGYELGVAITGQEDIATTLILTEGFGDIAMANRTFELLRENDGRGASVSGATQIRAGVIRPEVIIPSDQKAPDKDIEKAVKGLEIGDQLRVIRQPWFGKIGTVTGLPAELRQMESGAKVRVLELKLDDGEKIILPRANVEIIEE
jgi:hypothetical protein